MKITNRIKKILLFLLHPENTFQWFKENKIGIAKRDYYEGWQILSFCAKKAEWDFTHSEIVSYRRTLRIMVKLGLIEPRKSGFYIFPSYRLTDKGRRTAMEIEKEIKDLIKEYENLIVFARAD